MRSITGYRIQETLSQGGSSSVYRATRTEDGTGVILKVSNRNDPTAADIVRFHHEYNLLKSLDVPGVLRAITLLQANLDPVLVLEDLPGRSLATIIAERDLSVEQGLRLGLRVSAILEAVHQQGIIHKDVNPNNLIVSENLERVKLIDFGIATRLSQEAQTDGQTPLCQGTLSYIAPEQTGRMHREIDHRADLYSLGVTLYRVLTGKLPFTSTDPMELVHQHIASRCTPPHTLNPAVSEAVSSLVIKLLAKPPEDRYQSAFGLRHDLQHCLNLLSTHGEIAPFELGLRDVPNRFQRPQKLYGREHEIQDLMQALERARQGQPLLLLVTGASGIGKSALVNEARLPIAREQGYFIGGKFDQIQRDIPYRAFIQALQSLVRQILAEDNGRNRHWKQQILRAVGRNGQVLIDVIPELELIVGPQPEVQALPATQARNRFNQLFLRLIRAFARQEHPLVIFLDDLQWADSASLAMLKLLMIDREARSLLLIGAYRNQENGVVPLPLRIEDLEETGATIQHLNLAPLQPESVQAMVQDTFHCDPAASAALTAAVFEKTQGNPFFINEFIQSLYDQRMIRFDPDAGAWQWDAVAIRELSVTDNVADFMVERIHTLGVATRQALQLAACIGNRFDLETLAMVAESPPEAMAERLWLALEERLIQPVGGGHELAGLVVDVATSDAHPATGQVMYRFVHDRVQQAAYSLILESQKPAIHHRIGALVLGHVDSEQRGEKLPYIVNQLNKGAEVIADEQERIEVAALNLEAGLKAKAAAAFSPALHFFSMGTHLLPEHAWRTRPQLALNLHREQAECQYLTGDLQRAEQSFDNLLARELPRLAKAEIYQIRLLLYTTIGKYPEAVAQGLAGLRLLGLELNPRPTAYNLLLEHMRIRRRLRHRPVDQLADLPKLDDPQRVQMIHLLLSLGNPSYLSGREQLMALTNLKAVGLSLAHGNSDASAYAYSGYGLLLATAFRDIDLGYRFARLAQQLSTHSSSPWFRSKTLFVVANTVLHWKRHLREGLPLARQAYQDCLDSGDNLFGCYLGIRIPAQCFLKGDPLDSVTEQARKYLEFIRQTNDVNIIDNTMLWLHIYLGLQGKTASRLSLNTTEFEEQDTLERMRKGGYRSGVAVYYIYKSQAHLLNRDFPAAIRMAQLAEPHMHSLIGLPDTAEISFYHALALASQLPRAIGLDRIRQRIALAHELVKLKRWADHCPANFRCRHLLVLAEQAAARKRQQIAMRLYDEAIQEARNNDFTQIEAMGNEWAARFYRRCGFLNIALGYLRAARRAYLRWGATPKAEELQQTLQEWEPQSREAEMYAVNSNRTTATDNMQLDLQTVVKAAATISGEIVTQNLLQKMINLVVENAGAQRGVLLLDGGDGLTVQAERLAETSSCILLQSTSLTDYFQVPRTVINYVARTSQRVVLADAGREGRFAADPYIVEQHTKSVLCLPIVRSVKLIGVLYLENNLTRGAFTAERVGLLSMLSSQMAISIENADLYRNLQQAAADLEEYNRDLESKVLRRTEELNKKNIDLNDALGRVEQANHKIEESLQYARMIQESLLPSRERITQLFPESFLLWMPRDIVGGDVFFAEQVRNERILVLADCTGHGVPGALMTVIVVSALRQLVGVESCVEPAEILQRLNFIVKTALRQDSQHARSDDGLDAAVCRIDSDRGELTFAGAALPLYCTEKGQLRLIRGDRQSIGYKRSDVAHRFTTQHFALSHDSCIYLATDGYADQLGGEKGFPMGSTRLRKVLLENHRKPLPEQHKYLQQEFNRYQGSFPRLDDVTLLGLKI